MNDIARAYVAACDAEIAAPKPGNVHDFADGHRMRAADFRRSARISAPEIARTGASLGERVLGAITATRASVGQNTNLGIVLLCAPLAIAAESGASLRDGVRDALHQSTDRDAALIFQAIVHAAPGGLGATQRNDVHGAAPSSILDAMHEAADRDSIAFLYAHDFAPLFDAALPDAGALEARGIVEPWRSVAIYLRWLAWRPDSHVVRKHGIAAASAVQQDARAMRARLDGSADASTLLPELLAWDSVLKRNEINPGTSADLTVATIFARVLGNSRP